jgi:hypothetical protein
MVQAAMLARQSAEVKVMETTQKLAASENQLKVHASNSACDMLPAPESFKHLSSSVSD